MKEERRLVWRVLSHWKEMANGGRFPSRDDIDPWTRGEDGANCVLIAVESPIELSHFVMVGVNLAIALCPIDTLAGVLLSRVPRVVSARRGLMIEGEATLRGVGILYRSVLLRFLTASRSTTYWARRTIARYATTRRRRRRSSSGRICSRLRPPICPFFDAITGRPRFESHSLQRRVQ
jgi:hypothetical protein